MVIPISQLETWSHQGATVSSKRTHETIRNVLESNDHHIDGQFKTFLQGSYKNSTNIYGDSDVDIVVRLDSTYYKDLTDLSIAAKERYNRLRTSASYGWSEFRSDVMNVLEDYYGSSSVKKGDKALKVEDSSLDLDADVLICAQYRKYKEFSNFNDQNYIPGVVFWTQRDKKKIVNYPTEHYENGCDKNQETESRYKETVRIFKNARSYMVDKEIINIDLAPSYFIECLLYNIPDDRYVNDYQERVLKIFQGIVDSDLEDLKCQNEVQNLFGPKSTQWSIEKACKYLRKFLDLWENW